MIVLEPTLKCAREQLLRARCEFWKHLHGIVSLPGDTKPTQCFHGVGFTQSAEIFGACLTEATALVRISSLTLQPHHTAPCTWVYRIYSAPYEFKPQRNVSRGSYKEKLLSALVRRAVHPRISRCSTCSTISGALRTTCSKPRPKPKLIIRVDFKRRTPSSRPR